MKKIVRKMIAAALMFSSLTFVTPANAEVQTYTGVGEYVMSDFETPDVAKQRAQARAEKNAQAQAGVYVNSYTKTVNSRLAETEVVTITNGVMQVIDVDIKIIPLESDKGIMYRATVKANIDSDKVDEWLSQGAQIRETLVAQNEELQQANARQEQLIVELQRQLTEVKTYQDKYKIANEYAAADKIFLSNQRVNEASKIFGSGNYDKVIALSTEAINLNPNNDTAYAMRGSAYGNIKNYNAALQDFNSAINLGRKDYITYYCRGLAYVNLNNYNNAISDFNQAISLNPNYANAYYYKAYCAHKLGDSFTAQSYYAKAKQLGYRD